MIYNNFIIENLCEIKGYDWVIKDWELDKIGFLI